MNPNLERFAALMNKWVIFGSLGALLVVVAACSQSPTPCQLQGSATGGYVVKLTRNGPASSPACDVAAATPAQFSDVWVFEQYTDQNIAMKSAQIAHPPTSQPNSPVYAKGKFTSVDPDNSNPSLCKVATMSTESNGLAGSALLTYTLANLQFLSGTAFLGTEFAGDTAVQRGGCSANYTVQGLSPTVGCDAAGDGLCDPFHQPFSSGIQSNYNQGCHIWNIDLPDGGTQPGPDTWAEGAGAFLGFNGVCFFNAAFPSLGSYTP